MEIKITLPRVLFLLACLAFFAVIGGFDYPDLAVENWRYRKAWFYCVLLFLSGAFSATLVDHFVGNIERSNLRPLYVVVGVIVMTVSCLWTRAMHSSSREKELGDEASNQALRTNIAIIRPVMPFSTR